ncbi:T9SS type A sorting domain-containing protein [Pontibacter burrus]|uniref:T9SS type A sorting domain-containing protein n=1 Tax=Pontibacter burrus TaxID=2704466 RepID=A0A6B3LVR6_9BACT|nr:T9SS type A sorting domain-containing protein [Pontibacter burrus]NEM97544.1 T9SS type A sorting domain-containing protein [Pontibacter burrus]
MKTKQTYAWLIAATVLIVMQAAPAKAQNHENEEHELHTACTNYSETLSGIYLNPDKKGTFKLDFEQALKEDAVLEITNTAGQKVFQKPVNNTKTQHAWSYNVGKLKPDTYLVEVKTSDTTYWTRFKVGK